MAATSIRATVFPRATPAIDTILVVGGTIAVTLWTTPLLWRRVREAA